MERLRGWWLGLSTAERRKNIECFCMCCNNVCVYVYITSSSSNLPHSPTLIPESKIMEALPPLTEDGKSHCEVLLFNRWTYDDVQVYDLSVEDYITATASKHPIYMPHTAGRYQARRFRKAQCPIVERLTNSLMMHGRNNGKKLMAGYI